MATTSSRLRERQQFLTFGAPLIGDDEIAEVFASMKSGWLGTGPKVQRFEEDFRTYKSSAFAIGVSSCTAALHLAMLASEIRPGDEVITSAMTFCATVNAIIHAGATPVLADIDFKTMNIDPVALEKKITARTRAIIPVHFAGRPCDMEHLCQVAASHDLTIIEDCAHAVETEYKAGKAGNFGRFGCFSFYATKNVTTGEGGMVLTSSLEDAARIKRLALHGLTSDAWKRFSDSGYKHYEVVECGYKYNMMDLQAAIGIHQLRKVENNWQRRREIWARYNAEFDKLPLTLPAQPEPDTRHAYHLYTVLIDETATGVGRDRFLNGMTALGIGVGVHYMSIPEHSYYRRAFGWKPEDYPNAMKAGRQTVSLPLSPKLSDEDVEDVVGAVTQVLGV